MPKKNENRIVEYGYDDIRNTFEAQKNRDNADVDKVIDGLGLIDNVENAIEGLDTFEAEDLANMSRIFDNIFGKIVDDQKKLLQEIDDDPMAIYKNFAIQDQEGNISDIWTYIHDRSFDMFNIAFDENICKTAIVLLLAEGKTNILYAPAVVKDNEVVVSDRRDAVAIKKTLRNAGVDYENDPLFVVYDDDKVKLERAFDAVNRQMGKEILTYKINKPDKNGRLNEVTDIEDETAIADCERKFNYIFEELNESQKFSLKGFKRVKDGKTVSLYDEVRKKLNDKWKATDNNIDKYVIASIFRTLVDPDATLIYEAFGVKQEFNKIDGIEEIIEQAKNTSNEEGEADKEELNAEADEDKSDEMDEEEKSEADSSDEEIEEDRQDDVNEDEGLTEKEYEELKKKVFDNYDAEYSAAVEKVREELDKLQYIDKSKLREFFDKYRKDGESSIEADLLSLDHETSKNARNEFNGYFRGFFDAMNELCSAVRYNMFGSFAIQNKDGSLVNVADYTDNVFAGKEWYDEGFDSRDKCGKAVILRYLLEDEGKIIFRPSVDVYSRNGTRLIIPLVGKEIDVAGRKEIPLNIAPKKADTLSYDEKRKLSGALSGCTDVISKRNEEIFEVFSGEEADSTGAADIDQETRDNAVEIFDKIFAEPLENKNFNIRGFKVIKAGKTVYTAESIKKALSEKWCASDKILNDTIKALVVRALSEPGAEVVYDHAGVKQVYRSQFDINAEAATNSFMNDLFTAAVQDKNRREALDKENARLKEEAEREAYLANNLRALEEMIEKENHSEIYDLEINTIDKRGRCYTGRESASLPYYQLDDVKKEDMAATVKMFDEIYGSMLEYDKDFLDNLTITNKKEDREISLEKLYSLSEDITKKQSRDLLIEMDLRKAGKEYYKKFLFMRLLTDENAEITYNNKKLNVVVPIKAPEPSEMFLAESRAHNITFFVPNISSGETFKFSFNNAENYNKRFKPEEVSSEELDEAAQLFDKAFKNLVDADMGMHKNILDIVEIQADTDLKYETVSEYVSGIHSLDDITPEQLLKYEKAYVIHALADPREKIRIRAEVISPKTGEILKEKISRGKYRSVSRRNIPANYPKPGKFDLEKDHSEKVKQNKNKPKYDKEAVDAKVRESDAAYESSLYDKQIELEELNRNKDLITAARSIDRKGITELAINKNAGKLFTLEELAKLSDEDLAAAEAKFDEVFAALKLNYDNMMGAIKERREKRGAVQKYWDDPSFAEMFDIRNDKEELIFNPYDIDDEVRKTKEMPNNKSEARVIRDKYIKAYILRAMTVPEVNIFHKPYVKDIIGSITVEERTGYVGNYMDINHPKEVVYPEIKVEEKTEEEKLQKQDAKQEAEKQDPDQYIFNKDYDVRPFKDSDEIEDETIIEEAEYEGEVDEADNAALDMVGDLFEGLEARQQADETLANDVKQFEEDEKEYNYQQSLIRDEKLSKQREERNKRLEEERKREEEEARRKAEEERIRLEEERKRREEEEFHYKNDVGEDGLTQEQRDYKAKEAEATEFISGLMDGIDKADKTDIYQLRMNQKGLDIKDFENVLISNMLTDEELEKCHTVFTKLFKPLIDHQMPLYDKYNVEKKSVVRHMHIDEEIFGMTDFFERKGIDPDSELADKYKEARVLYYMARRGFSLSVDAYYEDLILYGKPETVDEIGNIRNPEDAPELVEVVEPPKTEVFTLERNEPPVQQLDIEQQGNQIQQNEQIQQEVPVPGQEGVQIPGQDGIQEQNNNVEPRENINDNVGNEQPPVELDITRLHPEKNGIPEGPSNPGARRMERFVNGYKAYKAGINGMLEKLEGVKNLMLHSQDDKTKNFYGFEREGSRSYQDMTQSLHELMKQLEAGHYSPDVIRQQMLKTYNAAVKYYTSHYGLTGWKYSEKGKDRLRASEYLVNRLPVMMNTFSNLRVGVSFITDVNGDAYGNRSLNEIGEGVNSLMHRHPDVKASIEARNDYPTPSYDELNRISIVQLKLREQIGDYTKTMSRKYEYTKGYDYYLHIKNNESTVDKAKYFVSKKYLDKIYRPHISLNEANEVLQAFDKNAFKKEYTDLANNPSFKAYVRSNPNHALSGWKEVERKTDEELTRFRTSTSLENQQTLKNRVVAALTEANNIQGQEERRNAVNNCIVEMAGFITEQVLQNPKIRYVVNEMIVKSDQNLKVRLVESVKNMIIRSGVINRRGAETNDVIVERVLNDNNFKANVMNNLHRNMDNIRRMVAPVNNAGQNRH